MAVTPAAVAVASTAVGRGTIIMEILDFSHSFRDAPARRASGRARRQQDVPHQAQPPLAATAQEPIEFTDPEDGRRWTVVEQVGDRIPGARGATCLCFQAHDIFRRVWRFPANWRELSDAELAALSRSW